MSGSCTAPGGGQAGAKASRARCQLNAQTQLHHITVTQLQLSHQQTGNNHGAPQGVCQGRSTPRAQPLGRSAGTRAALPTHGSCGWRGRFGHAGLRSPGSPSAAGDRALSLGLSEGGPAWAVGLLRAGQPLLGLGHLFWAQLERGPGLCWAPRAPTCGLLLTNWPSHQPDLAQGLPAEDTGWRRTCPWEPRVVCGRAVPCVTWRVPPGPVACNLGALLHQGLPAPLRGQADTS